MKWKWSECGDGLAGSRVFAVVSIVSGQLVCWQSFLSRVILCLPQSLSVSALLRGAWITSLPLFWCLWFLLVVIRAEQRLLPGVVEMSRLANDCLFAQSENSAILGHEVENNNRTWNGRDNLLSIFVVGFYFFWSAVGSLSCVGMALRVWQQWQLFSYPKKFKNIAASCLCWLCNAAVLGCEPKSQR